ncbi:MAG: M28 family peptidase [Planctomycetales bacterium]|nr:M28 family peptidase [Planctomycetales bacterium]
MSAAIGMWRYRGPEPLGMSAPADRPSAARMRKTLIALLGNPPQVHTTGTESGEQFLQRLEDHIGDLGFQSHRIEIPWDPEGQMRHPKGQVQFLPPDAVLKNLLVTVDGKSPDLAPILVATHHDSCRWGPGAGDAGSAVVALIEHLRILSRDPPNRTTHYLFTDGEEYGLLGAYALAAQETMPFRAPVFVLNFDARGTSGGVPMFETHSNNQAWVDVLINHLAPPKITSSLAVTVYRTLPNATDFNVWNGQWALPGFNYATISGAHRYHTVDDRPEIVSDRTLQHMGDQLESMHRAIDSLDAQAIGDLTVQSANDAERNAVFFDLYGITVIHFSELLQKIMALVSFVALCIVWFWPRKSGHIRLFITYVICIGISIATGFGVGWISKGILLTTPWRTSRYTPVDQPAGLITLAVAFLVTTVLLEKFGGLRLRRHESPHRLTDLNWIGSTALGVLLAFLLPGGAYLLVVPGCVYAMVRVATRRPTWAAWCGMIAMAALVGPLLTLLVQALGPWQQPLYGIVSGLIALTTMTVWCVEKEGEIRGDDRANAPFPNPNESVL